MNTHPTVCPPITESRRIHQMDQLMTARAGLLDQDEESTKPEEHFCSISHLSDQPFSLAIDWEKTHLVFLDCVKIYQLHCSRFRRSKEKLNTWKDTKTQTTLKVAYTPHFNCAFRSCSHSTTPTHYESSLCVDRNEMTMCLSTTVYIRSVIMTIVQIT